MADFPAPDDCDYCPILHKCIKYRVEPKDMIKLEAILEKWDSNKKGIALLIRFGRLVKKLRGSGYGK